MGNRVKPYDSISIKKIRDAIQLLGEYIRCPILSEILYKLMQLKTLYESYLTIPWKQYKKLRSTKNFGNIRKIKICVRVP